MKERPILFSGPMVRAILDGRKTQTRRIIQSPRPSHPEFCLEDHGSGWIPFCSDDGESSNCDGMEYPIPCPYGQPGDGLWVRETWRQHYPKTSYSEGIVYRADAPKALGMGSHSDSYKWKPSIFMPRKYCRLIPEVKAVRVERLQKISGKDAKAEGTSAQHPDYNKLKAEEHVYWFRGAWNSINAKRGYGWDANPWVWVIEFERIKQ